MLHRKPYATAGPIIDRNQASANPPLNLTLMIDQDLEDIVRTIPSNWWHIQPARAAGLITTGEYFIRLMAL
jgi:hypothetical protein